MYSLKLVSLENCPYSIAANDLLKDKKINIKFINVTQNNKETFKNEQIKTFPQIYLIKNNRIGDLLVGGYSDIKDIIDYNNKGEELDKQVKYFTERYPTWSRKAKLRLIELLN
jgi:glutaredoxin